MEARNPPPERARPILGGVPIDSERKIAELDAAAGVIERNDLEAQAGES